MTGAERSAKSSKSAHFWLVGYPSVFWPSARNRRTGPQFRSAAAVDRRKKKRDDTWLSLPGFVPVPTPPPWPPPGCALIHALQNRHKAFFCFLPKRPGPSPLRALCQLHIGGAVFPQASPFLRIQVVVLIYFPSLTPRWTWPRRARGIAYSTLIETLHSTRQKLMPRVLLSFNMLASRSSVDCT